MKMNPEHTIYVIYYKGKPFKTSSSKIAYLKEGTAKAVITGKCTNRFDPYYGQEDDFEIIPYRRVING